MNLKKTLIFTLSFIFIVASLAGCRKVNNSANSFSSSDISSNFYGVVDVIDDVDDASSTEDTTSEIESGDDATSTTSSNNEESSSNNASSSGNKNNTSSKNTITNNIVSIVDTDKEEGKADDVLPPTYVEESSPESSSDDSSTYEKPTYSNSPSAKGRVKTVEIPAGRSVYYKIGRVSNKVLTIESANAYVIYDGVKYSSKNGVVSFLVESDLLASDQILFEIGNSGSEPESFTIYFTSPVGTKDNPKVLDEVGEKFSVTIKKGNDHGYFYSYKATKSGKIRFYILSDAKIGVVSVDKLIDPKNFIVQQRNTTDTGEDYLKTDSTGTYVEFDVKVGDQFTIGIAATGTFDSAQIVVDWKAIYA